jgi:hypothetical protein
VKVLGEWRTKIFKKKFKESRVRVLIQRRINCPDNTTLWQRRDGGFLDDVVASKIPPNLPFPKGGICDIFIMLCGPTV